MEHFSRKIKFLFSKNYSLNTIGNIIRYLFRGSWSLIIPVILNIQDYNSYIILNLPLQILLVLSLLGTTSVILREDNNFSDILIYLLNSFILLLLLFFLIIKYFLTPIIFNKIFGDGFFIIIFFLILLNITYQIFVAYFKSKGKFKEILFIELISGLIFFLIFFAYQNLIGNISYYLVIVGDVIWLLIIISFIVLINRNEIMTIFNFNNKNLKSIDNVMNKLSGVYKIGILVIIDIIIWKRIEIFFLAKSADGNIGPAIFNISLLLGNTLAIIPTSVLEAWYPDVSKNYFRQNTFEFYFWIKSLFKKFMKLQIISSLFFLFTFIIYFLLFLKNYHNWFIEIFLFVIIRILFINGYFFSSVLYAIKKELPLSLGIFICSIFTIIFHILLTIKFGVKGCILAYFLSQMIVYLTTFYIFKENIKMVKT